MMATCLERMQAMAKRFNTNGSIDQLTMRKIDALVMSDKREEMTAKPVKEIKYASD